MKYDPRIVTLINDTLHFPEVLERERGDDLPDHDHNVSCVDHSDSSPSMRVYAEKGRHAFCFSCGKTKTPYSILKSIHGFNFTEIVEYLQENYNFTIPDNLDQSDKDIKSNQHVSSRINLMKKYMSINLLNLISKSLYIDSKNGGTTSIDKLYDKVISIKESGSI